MGEAAVQQNLRADADFAPPDVRRNIVISLLSTYALYLISSLIFFDVRPSSCPS